MVHIVLNESKMQAKKLLVFVIVAVLGSALVFSILPFNAYAATESDGKTVALQVKKSSKKKITKVKLNRTKFTQIDASKSIKPIITVYSGKKKLSSKNYKIAIYRQDFAFINEMVNGKWKRTKFLASSKKVKAASVAIGSTSYSQFKVVVKGKNGYEGSVSKIFKVKSAWTIKRPNGWKVGKYCDHYETMEGYPFRCLDKFEPVYDVNGKLLRYETSCGRYTVKK